MFHYHTPLPPPPFHSPHCIQPPPTACIPPRGTIRHPTPPVTIHRLTCRPYPLNSPLPIPADFPVTILRTLHNSTPPVFPKRTSVEPSLTMHGATTHHPWSPPSLTLLHPSVPITIHRTLPHHTPLLPRHHSHPNPWFTASPSPLYGQTLRRRTAARPPWSDTTAAALRSPK